MPNALPLPLRKFIYFQQTYISDLKKKKKMASSKFCAKSHARTRLGRERFTPGSVGKGSMELDGSKGKESWGVFFGSLTSGPAVGTHP